MKKLYSICVVTALAVSTSFAQQTASSVKFSKSTSGNSPVEASLTPNGIGDVNQVSNINIYSYGNSVFVNTTLNYAKSRVEIFNLLGEKVADQPMNGSSFKMDINSKASSYYIIKVTLDENVHSKRVYIR